MESFSLQPRARLVQQTAQGSAAWLTEPFNEFGGITEDSENTAPNEQPRYRIATSPRSKPCCGRRGIFQHLVCGRALDDKGKHDMICGMGGFTESRHNTTRDWLANKTRELEGATVMVEKEVDVPFVKPKGRMDLIFKDARRPEFAFLDVVCTDGMVTTRRRNVPPAQRPVQDSEHKRRMQRKQHTEM